MPAWAGKIYQKSQQNVLGPSKENEKKQDPSKCAFKNWLPPFPQEKRYVCKNKNSKHKLEIV